MTTLAEPIGNSGSPNLLPLPAIHTPKSEGPAFPAMTPCQQEMLQDRSLRVLRMKTPVRECAGGGVLGSRWASQDSPQFLGVAVCGR